MRKRRGVLLGLLAIAAIAMVGVANAGTQVWDNGGATGIWNTTDTNWDAGSPWTPGSDAQFGDTGAGTVTLSSDQSAGSVLINSVNDYTFANADINATGILTKNGAGTVTFTSDNSFAGGVFINDGEVVATRGGNFGATSSGGYTDITLDGANATLNLKGGLNVLGLNNDIIFDASGGNIKVESGYTGTLGGQLSGSGDMAKVGDGELILNNDNSAFTGGIVISGGTLTAEGGLSLGTGTISFNGAGTVLNLNHPALTLANNIDVSASDGIINVDAPNTTTLTGVISGSEDLYKTGDGDLILTGANTYAGDTRVMEGVLIVEGAGSAIGSGTGDLYVAADAETYFGEGAAWNGRDINNAFDGYIGFDDGSLYAGTGTVHNYGAIAADIDMASNSLADLASDTVMYAGSEFFIANFDASGDHVLDYDVAFTDGNTTAGSMVVLSAPNLGLGNTSIDIVDAVIYVGNADLNIMGHASIIPLASDIELFGNSVLATASGSLNGFTAEQNAFLWVVNDDASSPSTGSAIYAPKATFEAGASLVIMGDSHLLYESNATLGDGSFIFKDGANFMVDTYDMNFVDTGILGRLIIRGDSGDTADLVIGSDVEVYIDGERRNVIGDWFVSYDGTRTGEFVSNDYRLIYDDVNGRVWVAAALDTVGMMNNMFAGTGYEGLSVNKINGGLMTDEVLADLTSNLDLVWDIGQATSAFENLAFDGYIDSAWVGFGQLFGEYGAYSSQLLRESNEFFWNSADQRFAVTQNRRISANQGTYFGSNSVRPEDAYAVVRGSGGGFDVCKSIFTVWAEGFGAWSRQKNRHNLHGYNYDSGGFNLGFDYTVGRFDFSLFGGYTKGKLRLRDLRTKYDADIMNLGLSAAYTHESGFYGRAAFGYGRGWNDYDTNWMLGGTYHGKFDNYSITVGGEIGYIAQTSFANIIPSIGLTYTHYSQKAWSESYFGTGTAIPHWFGKQRLNTVDIPIGVRLNKVFCVGTMEIAPEIRTAWIYSAKRDNAKIDTGYLGSDWYTTMHGVNAGRNRWLIGGGIKARFNQSWDANLDYNFTVRSKYTTHNVTASIGYSF